MGSNKKATLPAFYSEIVEQFKHCLNKLDINICTPLIFACGRANLYVSVIIYIGSAISLEMPREDTWAGRESHCKKASGLVRDLIQAAEGSPLCS